MHGSLTTCCTLVPTAYSIPLHQPTSTAQCVSLSPDHYVFSRSIYILTTLTARHHTIAHALMRSQLTLTLTIDIPISLTQPSYALLQDPHSLNPPFECTGNRGIKPLKP